MQVHPALPIAAAFQRWATMKSVGDDVEFELAELVTPESLDQWDANQVDDLIGRAGLSTHTRTPKYSEDILYAMFVEEGVESIPPGEFFPGIPCTVVLYHDGQWRVHALGDYWHPPGVLRENP